MRYEVGENIACGEDELIIVKYEIKNKIVFYQSNTYVVVDAGDEPCLRAAAIAAVAVGVVRIS